MNQTKMKEIQAARAKLAALEASVQTERNKELAELPARYGFSNPKAFIRAVRKAAGRPRKARAVVTEGIREGVRSFVKQGETARDIAATLGISLPTVQNIKKALGLVKARKAA